MNKISTAIYMLIAIVAILAFVVFVAKPATYDTKGVKTGYISVFNLKGKA